jgi:hypothetical protein
MKLHTFLLAPALAFTLAGTAAFAAEPPVAGTGPVAEACMNDVKTLCPGVQPGEGRIAACLKDKRKDLSKACKTALLKARRGAGKSAD